MNCEVNLNVTKYGILLYRICFAYHSHAKLAGLYHLCTIQACLVYIIPTYSIRVDKTGKAKEPLEKTSDSFLLNLANQ